MADVNVLLLDAESPFATSVAACLAAANVRVHALSRVAWAPLRLSRHIASFHTAEGRALAPREIVELARRVGADLCLAVDEDGIRKLSGEWSEVTAAVPVAPAPTRASFDATADKWMFASFLESCDLPHPPTAACTEGPTLANAIQQAAYPVLLKPRRGGNGAGIVRYERASDVVAHIDQHAHVIGRYVIQSEFAGSDIDCSVLCRDGRVVAHTVQRPLGPSAAQFKPAGAIEFIHNDAVLDLVSRLMAALRWNGVAHVDLRCNASGELTIIEVNPRFWGSLHGSLRAGVNFPYLAALAGLGRQLPDVQFRPCPYVAGGAAVQAWLRSLVGSERPFHVEQTAWKHILHDPVPHLLDIWPA